MSHTYHKQNMAVMEGLDPVVRARVAVLLIVLDGFGQDTLLTSGKRTEDQQNALHDQGRKTPGKIVTHVRGKNSFHVWGVAFDLVPVRWGIPMHSKNDRIQAILEWANTYRFRQIAKIAMGLDFDWGYQMWGFDMPHFQYTQGLTITDFLLGKRLKPESIFELEVDAPTDSRGRGLFRRLEKYVARAGYTLVTRAAGLIRRT